MAKSSFYSGSGSTAVPITLPYVVTFNGRNGTVAPTTGDYSAAQITGLAPSATIDSTKGSIEYVIDGGGFAITPGYKGFLEVPCACLLTSATLMGDVSGSAIVDVWRCSFSQFDGGSTHPVSADTITGATPPTLSSAIKAQDSALSGWSKNLAAGDIIAFHVNSASTVQRLTLSLKATRT